MRACMHTHTSLAACWREHLRGECRRPERQQWCGSPPVGPSWRHYGRTHCRWPSGLGLCSFHKTPRPACAWYMENFFFKWIRNNALILQNTENWLCYITNQALSGLYGQKDHQENKHVLHQNRLIFWYMYFTCKTQSNRGVTAWYIYYTCKTQNIKMINLLLVYFWSILLSTAKTFFKNSYSLICILSITLSHLQDMLNPGHVFPI